MLQNLFSGVRELRTGLITGFMILYSLFIIINKLSTTNLEPTFSIKLIYSLIGKTGLIIIISLIAYLIGVSFFYWLETITNKLHIWAVNYKSEYNQIKLLRYYHNSINPLSQNAKNRLLIKLKNYYSNENLESQLNEDVFIKKNLNDILWMDGRLEENKTTNDFIRLNTEGYFRICIGLLLPLVVVSTIIELNFHWFESTLLFVIIILASHWLVMQGFYLHKKSISMLAHHIADGKFLTPTMANAKSEKQKTSIK